MLRGSEKEPEGGERNGGGNGLGLRFANKARPVSNRNGEDFLCRECSSIASDPNDDTRSGRHLGSVGMKDRRAWVLSARAS